MEITIEPNPDGGAPPPAQSPPPRPLWRRIVAILERSIGLLLWSGVILSAAWLAFAWLYPQELAETRRPLMVLNCAAFVALVFQYHIGLACLAAAAGALILRRWRLLAMAMLVALPATVPEWWTYRAKSPPPVAGDTLRVATLNMYVLNNSPHFIVPQIEALDADILLIQEWHTWHERFIQPELAAEYPYQVRFAQSQSMGMAIFSRRPFLESTPDGVDVRLGEALRMQRIVIEHDGRPLAIYNLHMASPGHPERLLRGQRQTAQFIGHLQSAEPHPFIVAGDLNSTRNTANLAAFRGSGLAEAHDLAGRGRGATWPNRTRLRHLPGLRIDHIFLSPELSATGAGVGGYHGSDHRATWADLGWRAPARP